MSAATTTTPATDEELEALATRLFMALIGSMELQSVHVGRRLGLYAALRDAPSTIDALAAAAGIAPRYAREWLEQQAVAGFVTVDDAAAAPAERTYTLPDAMAQVVLDTSNPWYAGAAAPLAVGVASVVDDVADAYVHGGGVSYGDFGPHLRDGIAEMNAVMIDQLLLPGLTGLPDLAAALSGDATHVLDLGCGTGHSSVRVAQTFPQVTVHGIDLDPSSVEMARTAAADAGVADRVTFSVGDATALDADVTADVVLVVNALHDMGDPVGVLTAARGALDAGGLAVLVDDRCSAEVSVPGDEQERLVYGFSALHCLPATMAEEPVHAHGTVVRPATTRAWAAEAGFGAVREEAVLADEGWRGYVLEAGA